ncbi:MAG: diguanylate cyclase, partial [Alphaproteobacteria bacterium]|nr:diguanylate cyclase [Alphaproteobacteria bacterium]
MLTPVWDVLVYVVLPLWVLAGFADYLCHRATHIEHANGF